MEERSRVLLATLVGAVAGGVWGWLYLTAAGRRVRDSIEPKLDDFVREQRQEFEKQTPDLSAAQRKRLAPHLYGDATYLKPGLIFNGDDLDIGLRVHRERRRVRCLAALNQRQ